jgi:hypothetical protein
MMRLVWTAVRDLAEEVEEEEEEDEDEEFLVLVLSRLRTLGLSWG